MNWGGLEGLSGWCHAVYQDDQGLVWISSSDGLVMFDGLTFTKIANPPEDYEFFRTIFEISDTIYLGDYDKPLHYFAKKSSNTSIEKVDWGIDKELNIWTSYKHSTAGILLVDVKGIIYVFDPAKGRLNLFMDLQTSKYDNSTLQNHIRHLIADPNDDNKIWIASKQGLLHVDVKSKSRAFKRPHPSTTITNDPDDNSFRIEDGVLIGQDIWLSSYGNGLLQYDIANDKWKSYRYEPPYTGYMQDANVISALSKYDENNLIIGARDLKIFNIKDKQFYDFNRRHEGANPTSIPAVHIVDGQDGSKYIIAAGILSKLSTQHNKFTTSDIKLIPGRGPQDKISQLISCDQKSIIFKLNDDSYIEWNYLANTFQPVENKELFEVQANNKIGPNGNIWSVEHNTVYINQTNSEKIKQELIKEEYEDLRISDIHFDNEKGLWLFSNRGLIAYNLENKSYKIYNENDGLTKRNWAMENSACNCSDDKIVFSSAGQLAIIDPSKLLEDQKALQPYIRSVSVYNEKKISNYKSSKSLDVELQPTENYFSIAYTAYTGLTGAEVILQHKLEDYDQQWQTGGDYYTASYANIPPGEYQFKIRAKYLGNDWIYKNEDLRLRIQPTFTQSLLFKALLSILLLSLFYIFYRLRTGAIMKEERLRSSFKEELAKTKLEALRSQMNPHFLFNCLNSIDNYILNKQPQIASDYLSKFSKLMRKVLDHSKLERISLEEELDTLKIYIEMEQMRFDNKFDYAIKVSDDIDTHQIEIPPMLLQPYIENAIWHGLIHKEGHGHIGITINKSDNKIICEITDNGVGREMSKQLKHNQETTRKSHGMKIIKERLRLIKEIEGMGGDVVITDLNKLATGDIGTLVKLILPVNS